MDWRGVTERWVADGLIADTQREPLLARLEALEPDPSDLPASERPALALPVGALVTALVAPACWLMVGAVVALLAATLNPPRTAYDAVLGLTSMGLLLAGGVLRFVPSLRPAARGLLAAFVPVAVIAIGSALQPISDPLLGLMLVPLALGWTIGLLENSRAIAATSAVVGMWVIPISLYSVGMVTLGREVTNLGVPILVMGSTAAGVVLAALATWVVPRRSTTFQVGVPPMVLMAAVVPFFAPVLFGPLWTSLGVHDPHLLEKELLALAFGAGVLCVGIVARAPFTVLPGVCGVAATTVALATWFGDFIGAAIALAAVSLALFAGAMALWVVPTLRARSVPEQVTR